MSSCRRDSEIVPLLNFFIRQTSWNRISKKWYLSLARFVWVRTWYNSQRRDFTSFCQKSGFSIGIFRLKVRTPETRVTNCSLSRRLGFDRLFSVLLCQRRIFSGEKLCGPHLLSPTVFCSEVILTQVKVKISSLILFEPYGSLSYLIRIKLTLNIKQSVFLFILPCR